MHARSTDAQPANLRIAHPPATLVQVKLSQVFPHACLQSRFVVSNTIVPTLIGTLRVWPCLQSRFVVSNTIVPTLIGTLRVWHSMATQKGQKRASKNGAPYVVACVMSLHCPCVCTVLTICVHSNIFRVAIFAGSNCRPHIAFC